MFRCLMAGSVASVRQCFLVLALLILTVLSIQTAAAQDEFLHPDEAFIFSAAVVDDSDLHLHFKIAPQYYMYRDRFQIATEPDVFGKPLIFPKGTVKYDPTFGEDMEVYHDEVTLVWPLPVPEHDFQLELTSQGCAEAGLCYPPRTDTLQVQASGNTYTVSGQGFTSHVPPPRDESSARRAPAPSDTAERSSAVESGSVFGLGDTGIAQWLSQAPWYQVIGLSLLFGLLLTLTPCVLPMVPIVLAVVVNDARNNTAARPSRWRGVSLAAVYVLGMSLVYTVLGMLAGLLGASLSVWLQTPAVLTVFAAILAVLALAMFDVFSFQTPAGMQSRLGGILNRLPGGRLGGACLMGMLSALIVGPCVAAPLAGVLLFISQTGDVMLGGTALFAMAWGQGLLLLVLGAGSGALVPRAGVWMEGVKRFFGWLLLATAWWMVAPVIPGIVLLLGWVVLLLWAAVMLGAFEPLPSPAGMLRQCLKTAGLLLAFWAFISLLGLAAGGRDVLRPLQPFLTAAGFMSGQQMVGEPGRLVVPAPVFTRIHSEADLDALLATADRPVLLDFYADWCVSCIEMERFTFSDPKVASQMAGFLLLQADVTKNLPEHRALLKRFQLFGPPGILFFDEQGQLLPEQRVIGFKNATDFAALLQGVRQPAAGGVVQTN